MSKNFRIFCALIHRDLYVVKKRLLQIWIDAAVILFIEIILWKELIPLMGVPREYIGPLFLGSAVSQAFFFGMSYAFRNGADLEYHRFIDYRIILPVPKRWLFASNIVYFVIEALLVFLPFLVLGIIALGETFTVIHTSWLAIAPIIILTLALNGLMFLGCSFYYDYDWFRQNVWPRRFIFLYGTAPFYVLWYQIYNFSPRVAQCILLNPFTYTAEGLRGAIIGGDQFLSPLVCIPALLLGCTAFTGLLALGVKKRLDPV